MMAYRMNDNPGKHIQKVLENTDFNIREIFMLYVLHVLFVHISMANALVMASL